MDAGYDSMIMMGRGTGVPDGCTHLMIHDWMYFLWISMAIG
jgi:hypothetical protein